MIKKSETPALFWKQRGLLNSETSFPALEALLEGLPADSQTP